MDLLQNLQFFKIQYHSKHTKIRNKEPLTCVLEHNYQKLVNKITKDEKWNKININVC